MLWLLSFGRRLRNDAGSARYITAAVSDSRQRFTIRWWWRCTLMLYRTRCHRHVNGAVHIGLPFSLSLSLTLPFAAAAAAAAGIMNLIIDGSGTMTTLATPLGGWQLF